MSTEQTEEQKWAELVELAEQGPAKDKPADTVEEPAEQPEQVEEEIRDEPFPGFNAIPDEHRDAALAAFQAERERVAELEARYNKQQGQLGPTQRKVAEYERQNSELLRRLQAIEIERSKTAQTSAQTAFEAYEAAFPDEAAILKANLNPLQTEHKRQQEELAQLRQTQQTILQEMELQKNSAMVVKAHPDAYDILQDPTFDAWVQALDEDDLARANSTKSSDAIKTIEQFKRDKMLAELLENQKSPPPTAPKRKPSLDVDPNPRNRQSPAPSRSGNASGNEEEDFAAFAEAYEADPEGFAKAMQRR